MSDAKGSIIKGLMSEGTLHPERKADAILSALKADGISLIKWTPGDPVPHAAVVAACKEFATWDYDRAESAEKLVAMDCTLSAALAALSDLTQVKEGQMAEYTKKQIQRDMNPTPAARVAMIIWGKEYSQQACGSMGFWDNLSKDKQRRCERVVQALAALSDLTQVKEG